MKPIGDARVLGDQDRRPTGRITAQFWCGILVGLVGADRIRVLLDAVDARPIRDKSRVAAYGHSSGGRGNARAGGGIGGGLCGRK